MRYARQLLLVAAVLITAACASSPTESASRTPDPELTALPRALTTSEVKVRDAANAFAFALWGRVSGAQRDSNVFVSPLSASFALGMAMNGAGGATYDEMRSALQFGGASLPEINAGYKSLIALLTSLDPSVQMRVANSIWYRQGFPFRQAFFDTTRTYFDATVQGLDFSNPVTALGAINGWVNDKTSGRIPKVLDAITAQQVMFLINAIYFKGAWRQRFDPALTTTAPFHAAGGVTQSVPFMHRLDTLSYAEGIGYQVAELPYGNAAFSMVVLLPAAGVSVEDVSAALTPSVVQSAAASLQRRKVEFAMPKFTFSYARTLNDDLRALGMVTAFAPGGADFTQMAPAPTGRELFLDFVKQNSFVDVNEEGTEAAAVTTVGVGVTSMPSYPVMRVDRPFLCLLRERLTGTVLFIGKVVRVP